MDQAAACVEVEVFFRNMQHSKVVLLIGALSCAACGAEHATEAAGGSSSKPPVHTEQVGSRAMPSPPEKLAESAQRVVVSADQTRVAWSTPVGEYVEVYSRPLSSGARPVKVAAVRRGAGAPGALHLSSDGKVVAYQDERRHLVVSPTERGAPVDVGGLRYPDRGQVDLTRARPSDARFAFEIIPGTHKVVFASAAPSFESTERFAISIYDADSRVTDVVVDGVDAEPGRSVLASNARGTTLFVLGTSGGSLVAYDVATGARTVGPKCSDFRVGRGRDSTTVTTIGGPDGVQSWDAVSGLAPRPVGDFKADWVSFSEYGNILFGYSSQGRVSRVFDLGRYQGMSTGLLHLEDRQAPTQLTAYRMVVAGVGAFTDLYNVYTDQNERLDAGEGQFSLLPDGIALHCADVDCTRADEWDLANPAVPPSLFRTIAVPLGPWPQAYDTYARAPRSKLRPGTAVQLSGDERSFALVFGEGERVARVHLGSGESYVPEGTVAHALSVGDRAALVLRRGSRDLVGEIFRGGQLAPRWVELPSALPDATRVEWLGDRQAVLRSDTNASAGGLWLVATGG